MRAPQARGAVLAAGRCRQSGASGRTVSACAAAASVATRETKGDEAWTRSYYPKLVDTKLDEKDWCVLLSEPPALALLHVKHQASLSPSMAFW